VRASSAAARSRAVSVSVLCSLLFAAAPVSAAPTLLPDGKDKTLSAVRAEKPPRIDGVLDDEVWQSAPLDDKFRQEFPDQGAQPSERTVTRVVYDDSAVYVAVHAFDRNPEQIVRRLTRRDRESEADWIAVMFDSRHDRRTAYGFQLNAAGVQLDGAFYDDGNFTTDWDGVWEGAVSQSAQGWSAEFKIPLSVLRFSDAAEQTWGFQVARYISRRKETSVWAFKPSELHGDVSWYGSLTGLKGLHPRRTFELRPFGVARMSAATDSGGSFLGIGSRVDADASLEGGLDLKLGVTSNLTLDATANPDFGQVEADTVVLNLSRFESFFPEKRPFFLEGADIFKTPIQLFYSRRIGRAPTGAGVGDVVLDGDEAYEVVRAAQALRIWTATKLTGQVTDRLSVGVLGALTAAEDVKVLGTTRDPFTLRLSPPRSFAVARARYSFGKSYVGVIGTAVNRLGERDVYRASANHDSFTQGIDALWLSTDGVWRFTGQAVVSERVGGPARSNGDGLACTSRAEDPTCAPITRSDGTRLAPGDVGWGAYTSVRGQGEKLFFQGDLKMYSPKLHVNDAGFLPEFNKVHLDLSGGVAHRRPEGIMQSWAWFNFLGYALTFDGVPVETYLGSGIEGQLRSFLNGGMEIFTVLPVWDVHELFDGGRFERPPSAHANLWFGTDSRKKLKLTTNMGGHIQSEEGGGSFFINATVDAKPSSQLEISLGTSVGISEAVRLYDCVDNMGQVCSVESDRRTYLLADLASGYLSFTLRGAWTFSPKLSLQAYAQLFFSRGEFTDYRTTTTMGPTPFVEREQLALSPFTGDSDGDGVQDDDFQDTSLNLNVVLRWELAPGTVLFGVYTRSQAASFDLAGRTPRFQLSGLSSGPTEDVMLLKLVYFIS
jgi:hypothetical protein